MGTTTAKLRNIVHVLGLLGIDDEEILSVTVDNQILHPSGDVHITETKFRRLFGRNFTRKDNTNRTYTIRRDIEGVILFAVVEIEPKGFGDETVTMGVDRADARGDWTARATVPASAEEVAH